MKEREKEKSVSLIGSRIFVANFVVIILNILHYNYNQFNFIYNSKLYRKVYFNKLYHLKEKTN